jgi:hypothetical protein
LIMSPEQVQQQINDTLEKVFADDSVFVQALVKAITQEVYKELADSIKSAGDLDMYNFQSIEAQTAAHAAREIGERISWLVEP